MSFAALAAVLTCTACSAGDRAVDRRWTDRPWDAEWVHHPTASRVDYGVFALRRTLDLDQAPGRFVVHVTADNGYRLLVNGVAVTQGPATSSPLHWRFDTVDLAPWLKPGRNVVAALVWNLGPDGPERTMSLGAGLLVQGEGPAAVLNTGGAWRIERIDGYSPEATTSARLGTHLLVGPGDVLDAARYPWGWERLDFDDHHWPRAATGGVGVPFGRGSDGGRLLAPRDIPPLERGPIAVGRNRRESGATFANSYPADAATTVAANTEAVLLLDRGTLTSGYPELIVSGGAGARVEIEYAEAFVDAEGRKGHRDQIEGRQLRGRRDVFLPDGGERRRFRPLTPRTWRYLRLRVATADEPLVLEGITAEYEGYPLIERAQFRCDAEWTADLWRVGWRTARLCAADTFMDCPYYERLQYLGDTRIQALISLVVAGDDRLPRAALRDFDRSLTHFGLTASRYPSRSLQVIPPFSLCWVGMIHDYWRHRDDADFVRSLLPGMREVLAWHGERLNGRGLLGKTRWWSFVDWPPEWPWDPRARIGGVPSQLPDGSSSILSLQYAIALAEAAELESSVGDAALADDYRRRSQAICDAVLRACWNSERGLVADTPGGDVYSQHANALAVIAGAVPPGERQAVVRRMLDDRSLIQATLYFRFYVFRAMVAAGLADEYLAELAPWRAMVDRGLSTFPETPDDAARSDCHAWSASPCYDLIATVAGVGPAEPGYRSVRIAPAMGRLQEIDATAPHPLGDIVLSLRRGGERLTVEVTLPPGLTGRFEWRGARRTLRPGGQRFVVEANEAGRDDR